MTKIVSGIIPALTREDWAVERGPAEDETWENSFGEQFGRHGAAARALYGQVFGFTWEDVDDCLERAAAFEARHDRTVDLLDLERAQRWQNRADRIAALLPPRDLIDGEPSK